MKRYLTDRLNTRLAASFAVVALAGLAGLSAPSDRAIETQFSAVMKPQTAPASGVASVVQSPAVAYAGSEEFWLKQAKLEAADGKLEHVVWSKPLGVGDTFTVGSGRDRKELQVVAVKEKAPSVTRIEVGTMTGKQLWIQARDAALGTMHTIQADVGPALPL